ncbi:hypothetical protein AcV5_001839 [Taiwanofungus camphoratus]|nr:hypothetical protein AcV5_001839 [Antrodia cinnamomea]
MCMCTSAPSRRVPFFYAVLALVLALAACWARSGAPEGVAYKACARAGRLAARCVLRPVLVPGSSSCPGPGPRAQPVVCGPRLVTPRPRPRLALLPSPSAYSRRRSPGARAGVQLWRSGCTAWACDNGAACASMRPRVKLSAQQSGWRGARRRAGGPGAVRGAPPTGLNP